MILVDNASNDNSVKDLLPKLLLKPNFKLVRIRKNAGSAGGRIAGIKKSRGQYLFFLDADTVIKKNCLETLAEFLKKHPEVGMVHPKLLNLERKQFFDCAGDYLDPFGFLISRAQGRKDDGSLDYICPILSSKTAAAVIKKDVYKKVGGFDKDYFFLLEDTDLDWRLWLSGFSVLFFPKAVVYHGFNTSEKNKNKSKYYSEFVVRFYGPRNYFLTLVKNLGTIKLLKTLPLHLGCWFSVIISLLWKGSFKEASYTAGGILWNLKNLPLVLRKRAVVQKNRKLSDEDLGFLFKPLGDRKQYFLRLKSYISD